MDLLEIKKKACFGLTLAIIRFHLKIYAVRVSYNYCKRALVLRSHHLRVWLDIAYSISVKS